MRKMIRTKVVKEQLEKRLIKYERRIQRLAEEAYKVRQVLEALIVQETTDA